LIDASAMFGRLRWRRRQIAVTMLTFIGISPAPSIISPPVLLIAIVRFGSVDIAPPWSAFGSVFPVFRVSFV
jgi:hypothetical protein